jgi:hypothetical protein
LPFPEPPGVVAAASRKEPTLWIRRIAIWQEFGKPPKRDFKLERGLNIVCSPAGDDPDALATGHAAGKTMLCRFIRYCLGEESFADPDDAAEIRRRFPYGGIDMELRVDGKTWIMRRPFASDEHVAFQGESLEELSTRQALEPYDTFRDLVRNVGLDADQRALIADMDDVGDAWQFLLAWLTRDQECRIDGLLHWRHKDSSSAASVRTASDQTRLNMLRVALGLYSKGASALRKEIANATTKMKEAQDATRLRQQLFESIRYELARGLGIDRERVWPPPAAEILPDEASALAAHRAALDALADRRIQDTLSLRTDARVASDEAQLPQLTSGIAGITQEIEALTSTIDRLRETVGLHEREQAEHWCAVRTAKHPTCPYDGTPLDVDKARFVCPLPRLPDPAEARKIAEEADRARDKHAQELRANEAKLTNLKREQASLMEQVGAIRRRLEAHQLALVASTEASRTAWATKSQVRRVFELAKEVDEAREAEGNAKTQLAALQKQQLDGLSSFSTARLQRWFDYLIRRVVSPEASGTVTLDGNGLHPRIEWRGRRRSVALNSLQIVLFDLAAMLCAVEGDGIAPAFLIHDSPREGDLDLHTYARIFRAVRELGEDDQLAPFQYIVTTTTEPPQQVADRRRLTITADLPKNRLMMEDF